MSHETVQTKSWLKNLKQFSWTVHSTYTIIASAKPAFPDLYWPIVIILFGYLSTIQSEHSTLSKR